MASFPHKNVNAVVVFTGLNDYHHRGLILVEEDSRCKASLACLSPTILVTNVCFLCSCSLSGVHNLFISRPSVYLEAFSRWTHSPFYARLFTEIIRHNTHSTRAERKRRGGQRKGGREGGRAAPERAQMRAEHLSQTPKRRVTHEHGFGPQISNSPI